MLEMTYAETLVLGVGVGIRAIVLALLETAQNRFKSSSIFRS